MGQEKIEWIAIDKYILCMAILLGSLLFIQRTLWTLRYTRVSPVVQTVLSLQNKNHLQQWNCHGFSRYSPLLSTELQSLWPSLEGVVFVQTGYCMKLLNHHSCKVLNSQNNNNNIVSNNKLTKTNKLSFLRGHLWKQKAANNRIVLSQGCRMGRAGPATFLLPDTELQPFLCWEQHCHGVTLFMWFPLLVAAPGRPRQLLPALFLFSGDWSLLSS